MRKYDFNNLTQKTFTPHRRDEVGKRLDVLLSFYLSDYSRNLIQKLIKDGLVSVNQKSAKQNYRVKSGDIITVNIPAFIRPETIPADIPLDIIYEDEWIVAINKPPGLVVHPSAGHLIDTLVNALVHRYKDSLPCKEGEISRPGVIHRLDKNTSGIILVAKTQQALSAVSRQFEKRVIEKEYLAIVEGVVELDSDIIEKYLARHKKTPLKMAVVKKDAGKLSRTYYQVIRRFPRHSYLKVMPLTGRMHQIRVHLASIGHPCVGDADYRAKCPVKLSDLYPQTPPEKDKVIISRQALHAHRIKFTHPILNKTMEIKCPLPQDMQELLQILSEQAC